MEHYVICVWNGSFSEEDHVHITNYLSALFPDLMQYQHLAHFNEEIAVLLKPITKYIVVLNTSQESENAVWKCINEDLHIKDIIQKEIKDDTKSEFFSSDASDHISASLHSLADQFPAFGTYKLDVLLGSDVLRELSVSKEPVLAGAFIRLTRWHAAHFSIFEQSAYDKDKLNEWCEIINAHILQPNSKLNLGPPLWRGAVSINTTDKTLYQGFELKLDTESDQYMFHPVKENTKQEVLEHIVLSSKLQVIDEVSFASIPPYLISPVMFRLHLGRLNVLNEKSVNFINYLLSNIKVALIMRLEYAEINENIKPEKKYCTSRWKKSISSDILRDPKCLVSSFEKFITFAVTKSKSSDHIMAYPLRERSLDANFYFSIVNHRISSPPFEIPEEKSNAINENGIPVIHGDLFQKIMSQYMNLNVNDLKSDFSSIKEDIRNCSIQSLEGTAGSSNLLLEETDPSDWPERIQLLCKQMKNEESKDCIPANANASLGQSLKLPQQIVSFSSGLISHYFLPSGEHKNLVNAERIYSLNNTNNLANDFNVVLHSKWPEIADCIYHDIYYNTNCQTEDKESLGSQMVNLYVQHETASTCNNQQVIQNFSIILSEKSSTPSKEFRSPSCRAANIVNKRGHQRNSIKPKESSLKDLITKKILSSRTMHRNNTVKMNKAIGNDKIKRNLNTSLVPVRCSPRKKIPVNYKYPSTNRNLNNTKHEKMHDSNRIPDLLRKKIRVAVATALENNGISMTHAFYKPCGSKLFSICRTFLDDLASKKTKTSEYLQKIADAHVKQVIEFYKD